MRAEENHTERQNGGNRNKEEERSIETKKNSVC